MAAAEYRDKRKQVFDQVGATLLRDWQTLVQEGNALPGRIVSALLKVSDKEVSRKLIT